jgi:uncharacterized protein YhaN
MPIFIDEISVQGLGPLRKYSFHLGKLNLIYGRNERGKTYLVEFVIRSLFRNAKDWGLRESHGVGKVMVSGLAPGHSLEFSPASPKKLDDFWEEANAGLPPDFSKLLVVKGAQVELSKGNGGADKAILKRILSSRELLDKIEKKISASIQKSEMANGEITGPNTGERKRRNELLEKLSAIDELFKEIDKSYSGGSRQALMDALAGVERDQQDQQQARRYLAYQTDLELRKLRDDRNRIPSEKIQEVRNELNLLKQKTVEYRTKQDAQRESEVRSQHYLWLKNAHEVYQTTLGREALTPKPAWLYAGLAFILLSAIFAILNLPILAVASLAGIVACGWFYFQAHRRAASRIHETQELHNLKAEFKNMFQRDLSGLPAILELLQKMEEDYSHARLLKKQLAEEYSFIKTAQRKLEDQMVVLAGEKKDPKSWDEVLRLLENRAQKLENQIHEKDKLLAKLSVDASDFVSDRPAVEFSKQRLESLESKHRQLRSDLDSETRKLESLKQRICDATREDIVAPWEVLIEKLRRRREQVSEEYKQKTAEIIGKIAVRDVISEIRKTEDSKILAGLKSPEVETPLLQMTGRYQSLALDNDRLTVSDRFNTFPLSELSSGAQEQVLLALRVGFSARLMNRDRLFLILDDAFQYSDWERRKLLVEKIAALANDGWQIVYFTMDDNIRELFAAAGKDFGENYKYLELKEE